MVQNPGILNNIQTLPKPIIQFGAKIAKKALIPDMGIFMPNSENIDMRSRCSHCHAEERIPYPKLSPSLAADFPWFVMHTTVAPINQAGFFGYSPTQLGTR